jgi:hypothetical protein
MNLRIDLKFCFAVLMAFLYFFRPQILHPLLSTSLIPALFGSAFAVFCPRMFERFVANAGIGVLISTVFILVWCMAIDILAGGLAAAGPRSFTVIIFRLIFVTFLGGFFLVSYCCRNDLAYFVKVVKAAIFVQALFALAMLLNLDFKDFMYRTVSGYTGTEKVFRDHFYEARIFGWSEELFYLAPVFMSFFVIFFLKELNLKSAAFVLGVVVVSVLNARLAIVGVIFGCYLRFGLRGLLLALLLLIGLFAALLIRAADSQVLGWLLSDFSEGGSRTLRILLEGHVIFLMRSWLDYILGAHVYLFAGVREHTSDIGWLIIFNYGGWVFLILWVILIFCMVRKAFDNLHLSLVVFLMFSILAIKGLAFSSNSFVALIFCMALLRTETKIAGLNFAHKEKIAPVWQIAGRNIEK